MKKVFWLLLQILLCQISIAQGLGDTRLVFDAPISNNINESCFSPDQTKFYSLDNMTSVYVYDTKTLDTLAVYDIHDNVWRIMITADGKYLFVVSKYQNYKMESETGRIISSAALPISLWGENSSTAMSPELMISQQGKIFCINPETGIVTRTLNCPVNDLGWNSDLAYSSKKKKLAVLNIDKKKAYVFDLVTNSQIAEINVPGEYVRKVGLSSIADVLYFATSEKIYTVDITTGKKTKEFDVKKTGYYCSVFFISPDKIINAENDFCINRYQSTSDNKRHYIFEKSDLKSGKRTPITDKLDIKSTNNTLFYLDKLQDVFVPDSGAFRFSIINKKDFTAVSYPALVFALNIVDANRISMNSAISLVSADPMLKKIKVYDNSFAAEVLYEDYLVALGWGEGIGKYKNSIDYSKAGDKFELDPQYKNPRLSQSNFFFSPDRAYMGAWDSSNNVVTVWNAKSCKRMYSFKVPFTDTFMYFNIALVNGAVCFGVISNSGELAVFDMLKGELVMRASLGTGVSNNYSIANDGSTIFFAKQDNSGLNTALCEYVVSQGKIRTLETMASRITLMGRAANGAYWLDGSDSVMLYDPIQRKILNRAKTGFGNFLGLSEDGKLAYFNGTHNFESVIVFDMERLVPVAQFAIFYDLTYIRLDETGKVTTNGDLKRYNGVSVIKNGVKTPVSKY